MPLLLIIAVFVLGLLLRLYGGLDTILFNYDQARDAFLAIDILKGDLKLIGPPTDLPGVFHGPLYYYFLAPLYYLGGLKPYLPVLGIIFLNLFAGIIFYILAKKIFKSQFWGIISFLLYAVSFEAVSYARWLSNPTLVIPAYVIYLAGLWNKNWLLVVIGMGIAIQAQLFMLYLIPVTILYILIFKPPLKRLCPSILLLFLLLSTYLVAEVKFNFQGLNGLIRFFGEHSSSINIFERFSNYFVSVYKVFQSNL
ncbi:MAG: hypothetical protein Q7S14_00025 [bacterium]|nr:hypothetical protein [bacterium]